MLFRSQLPRRRYTAIGAAAVAAAALFGAGYAIGDRGTPPGPVRTVVLSGPAGAAATLDLLPVDTAGNWPVVLHVKGLPRLPGRASYTLWLTRAGELTSACGTFAVGSGATSIRLSTPYRVRDADGWAVVRTGTSRP